MHESFANLCDALDAFAITVLKGTADDRTLKEMYGWNCPPLTRYDLAAIPKNIANKIREANPQEIDEDLEVIVKDIPRRLKLLQADTVVYLYNGNAAGAAPAYMNYFVWLDSVIAPIFNWEVLIDSKALPQSLNRRLRAIQSELDSLVPNKELISAQINAINEAYETAESLPTDLQSLREARKAVIDISTDSAQQLGKINEYAASAKEQSDSITGQEEIAKKLVAQCEEAYRITTTKGLAAAFDQRASVLGISMWAWVAGLVISLCLAAHVGSSRVNVLSTALNTAKPEWTVVWMHLILTIFSVGAPVWFAWLATKQIGQRFRLAEDYGFKASVAKAYEGYRREAARIDEIFEARLFASALSRLEEAPLRLVEGESHGSPWHEFFSSKPFKEATESITGFKQKFIEVFKEGEEKIKGGVDGLPESSEEQAK